ncbi:MAG: carbamoyl-phosphate synthase small subunit [Spirochaetia bacterium]|nr:carbamoyl-phosphate synthase small subunit [Spirochaetia bacterium]
MQQNMLHKQRGGVMNSRYLILQDGTFYKGIAFGSNALRKEEVLQLDDISPYVAEAVFNTSMCAYTEVLTDNSYNKQMVVMTNPHIGTYGCDPSWFQHMSDIPQIKGFIVKKLYRGTLFQERLSIDQVCKNYLIPAIEGIDTRALTIHLRDKGAMYGLFIDEEHLNKQEIKEIQRRIQQVSPIESFDLITPCLHSKKIEEYGSTNSSTTVALIDYGTKKGIVDQLVNRGVKVSIIPAPLFLDMSNKEIVKFDYLFLSNGPGDPRTLMLHIKKISSLFTLLPIRGICLGHQIINLALQNNVEKLKFGHHGSNHPVQNQFDKSIIITSQNHNYSVMTENLQSTTKIWFTNLNDQSIEGIIDEEHKVMSTQFHPEGHGGSHDALHLFDIFLDKASPICQK